MNSKKIVISDDEEEIEFLSEKGYFDLFHDQNSEENSFFLCDPLKKPSPSFEETLITEENTQSMPLRSINSKRKRFSETEEWPVFLGSLAIYRERKPDHKYNFNGDILEDNSKIQIITEPLDDHVDIQRNGKVTHGLSNPNTYIKVSEDEKFQISNYFSQIWHFLLNFNLVELKNPKTFKNYIIIDVFLTNKATIKNFEVKNVLLNYKLHNDNLLTEKDRIYREQEMVKYCKESIIILFDLLNIKKTMSSLIVLKKKIMLFSRKYNNNFTFYPSIYYKSEQTAYYEFAEIINTSKCGIIRSNGRGQLYQQKKKNYFPFIKEKIDDENEKNEELNEEKEEKNEENKEYLHYLDSTKFNPLIPPKEMTTELHEYQQQALNWLRYREEGIEIEQLYKNFNKKDEKFRQLNCLYEEYELLNGKSIYLNIFKGDVSLDLPQNKFCKGGILADEMGLGKTIMMLALIHTNKGNSNIDDNESSDSDAEKIELFRLKPNNNENRCKKREIIKKKIQTLIVTPLTILDQWKNEILSHSKPNSLKVGTFYGDSRNQFPFDDYDIVLTTYDVLSHAYKAYKEDPNDKESILYSKDYITGIFAIQWFRVILDEAHNIKNRKSKRAEACYSLQSQYRWCLTGTPIQNHLDDLYSLLRFLQVEILGEEYTWWNTYVNNSKDSLNILKHIVGPILLRRTKKSLDKNGLPIIKLPGKNIEVVKVLMGEDERKIYDDLFLVSRDKFRLFMKLGVTLQNYSGIFAMLMKLRRCCDHPSLILKKINNDVIDNELKNFLFTGNDVEIIEVNQENNNFMNPEPFKGKEFYEEVVDKIKKGEFADCSICLSDMIEPTLSKCCHVLCYECFRKTIELSRHCPICRKFLGLNDISKIFR